MKKALFLLTALIVLFGCSSDKNEENKPNNSGLKLVKEIIEDPFDKSTTTINYTYTNNILTKSESVSSDETDVEITDYVYENGKLVKENYFLNSVPDGSRTYKYTGEVVSSVIISQEGSQKTYENIYNSKNQLTNSNLTTSSGTSIYTFSYDSKGNMTTISSTFDGSETVITSTLEYDTFNNPEFLQFSQAIINSMGEFGYSKNNLTKKTAGNYVESYSYQYNEQGYPIEEIKTINDVDNMKTTYFYE